MTWTEEDLQLNSYEYDLPEELIAMRPASKRGDSRLLVYHKATGEVEHAKFYDLPKYLAPNDELILNQSKVFPSRIFGKKTSGGHCEVLLLREVGELTYECMVRSSGKKKLGQVYLFKNGLTATLDKILDNGHFILSWNNREFLNQASIPLPPYIRGGVSDKADLLDYQTIFAKQLGSVAAPTAGLHFSDEIFSKLAEKGIDKSYVTLHVGPGTFAPVKSDKITEHKMHSERYMIEANNWKKIQNNSNRIVVGTTSLRTLESALRKKDFRPDSWYETDIFIHPGVEVKSIKGMVTNFHLPGSSLLMLVSALIGRKKLMELYQIAIKEKYRFYSYGDAMLILGVN